MENNIIKILHLIDDEKFTNFTIDNALKYNQIEDVNLEHFFLLNNETLKYTKDYSSKFILKLSFSAYSNFINNSDCDVIVIHCLTLEKCQLLAGLEKKDKCIVWALWGVDYYSTDFYKENLYFEETNKFVKINNSNSISKKLKSLLRPLYYKIKFGFTFEQAYRISLSKIDLFAPIIDLEFDIINKLPFFKAKLTNFSYANIENSMGTLYEKNPFILGDNIFIGNSNTFESNHLDVLHQLKKINIGNSKIIIPLSYGGTDNYKNEIIKVGNDFFGNNFIPLINFISKDEYNDILISAKIAIYNHRRQQALGNIIVSFYIGQKVFLSEKNLLFHHFKEKGYIIFSIEKDLNENEIESFFSNDEIEINRELLNKEYSEQVVNDKFVNFYKDVVNVFKRK